MTRVFVEKAGDSKRYNWIVRVGRGRGSRILSRHRLKRRALTIGREEAAKRGVGLREQMESGIWRTVH